MTNQKTKVKRSNILVCYDGGGYDGCMWERNVFLLGKFQSKKALMKRVIQDAIGEGPSYDQKRFQSRWGVFTDLGSSGRRGITEINDAVKLLEGTLDPDDSCSYDVSVYDLTKQSEIKRFQDKEPIPLVVSVVNKIACLEDPFRPVTPNHGRIWFECDMCGHRCGGGDPCDSDHGHMEGYHGCGGIAITADDKYCRECYDIHTCSFCGEFDVDIKGSLCEFHHEYAMKMMLEDENITGLSYDLNSNKMVESSKPWEDEDEGDVLHTVQVESRRYDKLHTFVLNAGSESQAIELVSLYLDGDYHKVTHSGELDLYDLEQYCLKQYCR